MSTVTTVGGIVVQLAFWSSVTFILWYTIFAPWWRYRWGRAVVSLDAAVALALLPDTAHMELGLSDETSLLWQWFVVCSIALIIPITVWRMYIIYREQRSRR